jgi:hypothetical protein
VIAQLVGKVYVIAEMPADTPVTIPVAGITLTPVLMLLHVPPASVFVRVTEYVSHTSINPLIAAGNGLTVNSVVI